MQIHSYNKYYGSLSSENNGAYTGRAGDLSAPVDENSLQLVTGRKPFDGYHDFIASAYTLGIGDWQRSNRRLTTDILHAVPAGKQPLQIQNGHGLHRARFVYSAECCFIFSAAISAARYPETIAKIIPAPPGP